ncbi:heat shock protein 70 [Mycena alexandri]|uniref:Heat shock protein 70 n=1 Tax=Mycena alexandri TaxID=1745969 RepID=A0AAD6SMB3_9AGAR|nr:heat shock protein 70 [Mycena alexandri]
MGVIGERTILIFNLSGGTFDVSLLTIEDGIFEVKTTAGNTHLGGKDFDNRLVNYFASLSARTRELCQDLFCSTLERVEKVFRDSKIDKANVREIILVGGSIHIPRIVKLVSDFFNGKEPKKNINPNKPIAYGATV